MKTFIIFVLALLVCETSAVGYKFLEWKLVRGNQLSFYGIKDYDFLSKKCDENPQCAGFDSNGNLLSNVKTTYDDQTGSLFVKDSSLNSTKFLDLNVWPYPQLVKVGTKEVEVSPLIYFKSNLDSQLLEKAWKRYKNLLFPQTYFDGEMSSQAQTNVGSISMLDVTVSEKNETLDLDTDQSYSLSIDSQSIKIKSKTIFGAFYALETLTQLTKYHYSKGIYVIKKTPIEISDFPSFPHRGTLVDTSRHFLPIPQLKVLIDTLSYAKMNVLHWHIADAQSFPMQSQRYPKLWEGSWSPNERYTTQELLHLVQYAKERGVRIIPEFDGPGHAWAWGVGYPELLPEGWATAKQCSNTCPSNPCNVPLDPTAPSTYPLLQGLYQELKTIFTDSFLHLGGDEVEQGCWNNSRRIAKYIAKKNITLDGLYEEFVQQVHVYSFQAGKSPINWEEVFNHFGTALDKRVVNHAWLSLQFIEKSTGAGYRTLNSWGWYLDHWNEPWTLWYGVDPLLNIANQPEKRQFMIGGESCMWAERMTASNLFHTVWPKNAAVSERLWNYDISGGEAGKVERALPRLHGFKCNLERRGINADPVYSWVTATLPSACNDS